MKNFINKNLSNYKYFYENLFVISENTNSSLFLPPKDEIKNIYIDKELLLKSFNLILEKPSKIKDYDFLLQSIVLFLNKQDSKKKINSANIFINGSQNQSENFLLTIEAKKDFKEGLLEKFITLSLEQASIISKSEKDMNIFKIKYQLKKCYEKIFNQSFLENEIPEKEPEIKKVNKI